MGMSSLHMRGVENEGRRRSRPPPKSRGALPPLVLVAASMEDPSLHLPASRCVRHTVVENERKRIGFDGAAAGWALDGPPESFF
jgi:hypothetical protein